MVRRIVHRKGIFVVALVFIMMLSIIFMASVVNSAWYDSNWAYRQQINVTANVNTPVDYQVLLVLNDSVLGSNFNWGNNCDDLRFVGVSSSNQLGYWIENCDVVGKEIYVWVKLDSAISSGNNYGIEIYYGNNFAVSNSSASNTFLQNQIFLVNGRCTDNTYCQGMDNHVETDYIRSVIGSGTFTVDGSGYVTSINQNANAWGTQDYYYSRYRFLFIPSSSGNYDFGSNSDDGSEVTIFPYDSYGDGFATGHRFGAHDIVAFWYGLHGTGTCGTSGTGYTRTLNSGEGYWIDYIMNEWGGGALAQMCMRNGGSYNVVSTANYPNELYARSYVSSEPTVSDFGLEETYTTIDLVVENPNPLSVLYTLQDKIFDFNITLNCIGPVGESCGLISSYARENSSGSFVDIADFDSNPLWTISVQPQTCILDSGDSCLVNFKINATGNVGNYYYINLFSSSNITNIDDAVSDVGRIRIIDTNIVSFNQTSFVFENFVKNSGDISKNLKIISNIGQNDNIVVSCMSGDCSKITENWVDGIDLSEGSSNNIEFICNDDNSGNYSAVFRVTSDGNPYFSETEIFCNVEPIYGPMLVDLITPTPFGNISVRQNSTFYINSTVNCVGLCGEISAYAIFSRSGWFDPSWNFKRSFNVTTTTNTLTGYQVLINFDSSDLGSNFNWANNCGDLRFVHDGNLINYWIEECDTISEEFFVWIKADEPILTTDPYEVEMYYGNNAALSLSNVSNTFRNDEIFQIVGRCPSTNANCNMENHAETNNIRSAIGTGVFTVDGSGYINEINMANNPYGTNDYFYMRFRWLFVPDVNGTYRFGSRSDDSSEITIFPYDGYGGGIRTGTPYGAHNVITNMYNTWHNNLACGDTTRVTINPMNLVGGEGYWMDYTMQEGSGGEDAIACSSINSGTVSDYNLFSTANFPGQIFARNYVTPEPALSVVGSEESLVISTINPDVPFFTYNIQPQTCVPVEDGSCSFSWLVNATGLIGSSYNVSVVYTSNLSSILSNTTLSSEVIIIDSIIPVVSLISPTNNSKEIYNNDVEFIWNIFDDDLSLNCSLYLDGLLVQDMLCNSSINSSINLSVLNGYHNWRVSVVDSDLNLVSSDTFYFYVILNNSRKIEKSIKFENSGIYRININILDLVNGNFFGNLIEWIFKTLNSGSRSPVENFVEIVSEGEYIGWENSSSINHSIAGIGDNYDISHSYIIGLD